MDLPEDISATDMLTLVNNAIATLLIGGQEYNIGTRHMRRADLSVLKSMRRELQSEIARDNAEGADGFMNTFVSYFNLR